MSNGACKCNVWYVIKVNKTIIELNTYAKRNAKNNLIESSTRI